MRRRDPRAEYVALFESDVAAHPSAYKECVRGAPKQIAEQRVAGLTDSEVKQMVRDLRAEMRLVAKLCGGGP